MKKVGKRPTPGSVGNREPLDGIAPSSSMYPNEIEDGTLQARNPNVPRRPDRSLSSLVSLALARYLREVVAWKDPEPDGVNGC
jgi:hypothetical protein